MEMGLRITLFSWFNQNDSNFDMYFNAITFFFGAWMLKISCFGSKVPHYTTVNYKTAPRKKYILPVLQLDHICETALGNLWNSGLECIADMCFIIRCSGALTAYMVLLLAFLHSALTVCWEITFLCGKLKQKDGPASAINHWFFMVYTHPLLQ